MARLPGTRSALERRVTETRRFQRRLFTAQAVSPGTRLLRRLGWVGVLFLVVLLVLWWERDGLLDQQDRHVSLVDVVYFAFVTITTVGYGDIVPVTERARLIDAIFITPARLIFFMIFVGTAYELVIQRWVEGFRMARLQSDLHDHIVICGFGAVGQMAAREVLARGIPPSQVLVLELSEECLHTAADMQLTGLRGDASHSDVLTDAAVERARGVIVCAGRDDTNALISLAVRRLSKARLVVAAVNLDSTEVLRHSGADAVVSPPMLGGYVLADALESPMVADLLVDLLSAKGEVEWKEVEVRAHQLGKPASHVGDCVVIAVRRDGKVIWPWQAAAQKLESGDRLIVVHAVSEAARG